MREKGSRVACERRTSIAQRLHDWCIGRTSADQLDAKFTLRSSM